MTRMQAARVFAKRRMMCDAQAVKSFDKWFAAKSANDAERYRTEFKAWSGQCDAVTALWRDLSAAWDSEEA